jgi:hypothetical protein
MTNLLGDASVVALCITLLVALLIVGLLVVVTLLQRR